MTKTTKVTKQATVKRTPRAKHVAPSDDNIAWVEGTGKLVGATVRKGKETVEQVPVVAKSFWAGVLKGYNG